MDTYRAFKTRLMEHLLKEGLDTRLSLIEKENGVKKEALVLNPTDGQHASPIIYLDSFFGLFKDERQSFEEIADCIVRTLKTPVPGFTEGLLTRENILENIVPTVVSRKENEPERGAFLCDGFLDLAILYRLVIRDERIGEGLVALPEELLRQEGVLGEHGMGKEALLQHAIGNMKRLYEPETYAFSGEFWMLAHKDGSYGAARILDLKMLEALSEPLGGSYFILPSSKHELILLPEKNIPDPQGLFDIVREANRTAVEKEDYLSDSVYYYDRSENAVILYPQKEADERCADCEIAEKAR